MAGIPIPNNVIQATNCADNNGTSDIIIPKNQRDPGQSFDPFTGTLLITVESEELHTLRDRLTKSLNNAYSVNK